MQQQERTYCEQCGTYRFKPAGALCWHCKPAAEKQRILAEKEAASAVSPSPLLRENRSEPITFGTELAVHHGVNGGYHTTRTACDCPAGVHGRCCKHRAWYCLMKDVREPAIRRQWASARKVAA